MDDWLSYFQAVVKIIYITVYYRAASEPPAYINFTQISIVY
jgi:hypothetical protein